MNESLHVLQQELVAAKAAEGAATSRRLNIEQQILRHPEVEPYLKGSGTSTFGAIKIAQSLKREWDQEALALLRSKIKPEFFPFTDETKMKEDRAMAKTIEERYPDLWKQIKQALTLTPTKPTVTIKDK